ncbi:hypothetical protein SUDANB67_03054 [Nocardiopsis dassonvillei]
MRTIQGNASLFALPQGSLISGICGRERFFDLRYSADGVISLFQPMRDDVLFWNSGKLAVDLFDLFIQNIKTVDQFVCSLLFGIENLWECTKLAESVI